MEFHCALSAGTLFPERTNKNVDLFIQKIITDKHFILHYFLQAGSYWVVLMDKYAADFALLIFGLCECVGLGWIYGVRRFINDIRTMVGDRIVEGPFFKWFPLNWCALTPAILSVSIRDSLNR